MWHNGPAARGAFCFAGHPARLARKRAGWGQRMITAYRAEGGRLQAAGGNPLALVRNPAVSQELIERWPALDLDLRHLGARNAQRVGFLVEEAPVTIDGRIVGRYCGRFAIAFIAAAIALRSRGLPSIPLTVLRSFSSVSPDGVFGSVACGIGFSSGAARCTQQLTG